MATYRLWPTTDGPASTDIDTADYVFGIEFEVSETVYFNGYHWWVPGSGDPTTAARSFRLYEVISATDGTQVPGSDVTSGTLTIGQWNYVPLASAITLAPGKRYRAVVLLSDGGSLRKYGATGSYWSSGAGASGITNGPLTAVSAAAATGGDQMSFTATSAMGFPISSFNASNYWLDVEVEDAPGVIPAFPFARYRAADLTVGALAAWSDEGSGGNDLVQATGASQPTVEAAGFNGHKSVLFDGAGDYMETGAYGGTITSQPNTIVVMGEMVSLSTSEAQYLFDGNGAGSNLREAVLWRGDQGTDVMGMFAGSLINADSSSFPVAGEDMCLVAIFNGASSELHYNNGGDQMPGNPGSQGLSGFSLAARHDGIATTPSGHMRVVEVLIYDRALDSTEIADLQTYFETTYAAAGTGDINGSGNLSAPAATMAGTGTVAVSAAGGLSASAAVLAGVGGLLNPISGSGAIASPAARLSGLLAVRASGGGDLRAAPGALSGTLAPVVSGAGAMASPAGVLLGELAVLSEPVDIDPNATPAGRLLVSGALPWDDALARAGVLEAEMDELHTLLSMESLAAAPAATDPPTSYPMGFSIHSADAAVGWPDYGVLVTYRLSNNRVRQRLMHALTTGDASTREQVRTYQNIAGAWSSWDRVILSSELDALFPDGQYARDDTAYEDVNHATWAAMVGAPEFTFVANSRGKAKIFIMARVDADAVNEHVEFDVEIRQNNSSGAIVHTPSTADMGIAWRWDPALNAATLHFGLRYQAGLTPGGVYWAQLQINTTGTTIDISDQSILYEPAL